MLFDHSNQVDALIEWMSAFILLISVTLLYILIQIQSECDTYSHYCHTVTTVMCHKAGQSAFLHTQLYLSTNFYHILFSNVSWH